MDCIAFDPTIGSLWAPGPYILAVAVRFERSHMKTPPRSDRAQIPLRARIFPARIAFTRAAWSDSVWSA
jgi:hypothetical protein